MKCKFCGARIKKSDELCPECGAFVSKKEASAANKIPEAETNTCIEKTEEAVQNTYEAATKTYNFGDYLLWPTILRFGGGIVLALVIIFSFDIHRFLLKRSSLISTIICIFLVLYLFFKGIVSIIQEKKCTLCITPERVYGSIPSGFFDIEDIDIPIEDIIAVNETGFHSRHSNPQVHIVTKEKEITVDGSSSSMLADFSKTLKEYVKNCK